MPSRPEPIVPRILGIDPGLQRSGYAVLTCPAELNAWRLLEAGVIRLARAAPLEERLLELERGVEHLLDRLTPRALACEQLYGHYKHPRTAILMAHARGVILAAAARRGIPIVHVEATRAKKLLTGAGHATKQQIQRAVAVSLHLPRLPEPHDVADAITIALCGWHMLAGAATGPGAGRPVRPAAASAQQRRRTASGGAA